MTESYSLTDCQDPIHGEHQQLLYWTVNDKLSRLVIFSIILAVPTGFAFFVIAVRFGNIPRTFTFGFVELGILALGYLAMIALHEGVHGFTMRLFGARPQYGVLWNQFMFYATAPGYGFRRNSYITVALAPLLAISVLAILGIVLLQGTAWVVFFMLLAILNGIGSAGDLWLTAIALRYPKTVYIVDERDGLRVLNRIPGKSSLDI